jgi:predicted enzyme related to lactoylglutathione lyase
MAKKIDPLNRKLYGAVSAMLTVSDVPAAVRFYQRAFGFSKRAIMNGPDGKPMHAELTLRGTTLMLGPENAAMGTRTAKSVGASPASLYLYVENVDKAVANPPRAHHRDDLVPEFSPTQNLFSQLCVPVRHQRQG